MSEDSRNYRVGYGRPPEETRFRKGRSGNPKGKAPGRKSLKTELLEELAVKVTVAENGRRRKMTQQSITVKRWVRDAAKGDPKARDQLLRMINQIEAVPKVEAANPIGAAKDEEILARFRDQLVREIKESDND